MKSSLIKIALMGFVAAACGDTKNDNENGSIQKAAISENTAVEYYSQFVTVKKKPNAASSPADINMLTSSMTIPQNNTSLKVNLEIFLFDDATFDATYTEENGSGPKGITGKWRLKGTQLLIGDLGIASGVTISGKRGFLLQMSNDLMTPGLKGKSFKFTI